MKLESEFLSAAKGDAHYKNLLQVVTESDASPELTPASEESVNEFTICDISVLTN